MLNSGISTTQIQASLEFRCGIKMFFWMSQYLRPSVHREFGGPKFWRSSTSQLKVRHLSSPLIKNHRRRTEPLFDTVVRIPFRRALNVTGHITNAKRNRTRDQTSGNQQLKGEKPEEHKHLLLPLRIMALYSTAVNWRYISITLTTLPLGMTEPSTICAKLFACVPISCKLDTPWLKPTER